MASDREKYDKALSRWDELAIAGDFSVPAASGKLAVILAYDHARDQVPGLLDPYDTFRSEALALADQATRQGKAVELVEDARRADFRSIMRDPSISDVTVIGNGCLSSVALTGNERRVDWANLARMSDHLKTGRFIQRFCGSTPRQLNVPLGLMAMASHNQVIAPVNKYVRPKSVAPRHNRQLKPVTDQDRLTYDDIKRQLPKTEPAIDQKAKMLADTIRQQIRGRTLHRTVLDSFRAATAQPQSDSRTTVFLDQIL